ncbi:hypothetical protein [Tsukamurella hominis]|uniref:hypothetical protein n=1 Tax=Tsukamurella hominis TaxID=1970232 RepID=UPI0039E9E6BE
MSTRIPSRTPDRALRWNGACIALIVAAIATGFIDAIPVEVTIGLCALGVVAGLVGVLLYSAHILAGWRTSSSSKGVDSTVAPDAGRADADASAPEPAAEPVAVQARPEPEPEPEGVEGAAGSKESADSTAAPTARCSCHGLPVTG